MNDHDILRETGIFSLAATVALISLNLHASTSDYYTVKEGDTLSEIAFHQLKRGSLYGVGGRVEKLLGLNPEIENAGLIEPGLNIRLRARVAELSETLDQAKSLAKTKDSAIVDEAKTVQAAPERTSFDFLFANEGELNKKRKWKLNAGAGVSFNNLDLVEKSSGKVESLASKASLNMDAEVNYFPTSRTKLLITSGMKRMELKASGTEKTENGSTTFLSVAIGGEYKTFEKLVMGLSAGILEQPFAVSKTGKILTLQKKIIPNGRLNARFLLDENSENASSIQLGLGLLGPSSLNGLDIESGREVTAGFELIRDSFNFNPYINWSNQNTSLYEQDNLALGLDVDYKF